MMKQNVLLGMSGGVDSSVAAMLLLAKGYNVIGLTFIFTELSEINDRLVKEAKWLANQLNIEHFVVDLRKEFEKQIIGYFVQEYRIGNTPFPCAKCNPELKFRKLLEYSKKYNCQFISTGHYAQISEIGQERYITKGVDREKDQSFFLWALSKDIRDKLLFPLGRMTKTEVRNYASNLKFNELSEKKDSLGVCFIEGTNYRRFLNSRGIKTEPGNFLNDKNEIIGQHKGIINYTIGQRRGLGVNSNQPLFVSEIRAIQNEIVLSNYNVLFKNTIYLNNYYFINKEDIKTPKKFIVKIRYRLQNNKCRITVLDDNQLKVELLEPLAMVANGQTAVFYDNERVVGGGFIESSE